MLLGRKQNFQNRTSNLTVVIMHYDTHTHTNSFLPTYLYIYQCLHTPTYLSPYLSIHLSTYLSEYLHISLNITAHTCISHFIIETTTSILHTDRVARRSAVHVPPQSGWAVIDLRRMAPCLAHYTCGSPAMPPTSVLRASRQKKRRIL